MGQVAYYRVSTRQQGKSGLGLDAQKAIVTHYYPDLVAEFLEVASGGFMTNRPKLEQAIRQCEKDTHTLVVAKVDRLSRKTTDALSIYERLDGRFKSCDLPAVGDEDPGMFKFILTIQAALAERERELISIRTRQALAAARKRGQVLGRPESLTQEARAMGPEAQRQLAISEYNGLSGYITLMREKGSTYGKIAERLNKEGHRTRTGRVFEAMTVFRIVDRLKKGSEKDVES